MILSKRELQVKVKLEGRGGQTIVQTFCSQLVCANGVSSPFFCPAPSNQSNLSQKALSRTESDKINFPFRIFLRFPISPSQSSNYLLPLTSSLPVFSSLSNTLLPPHTIKSILETSSAISELLLCTCGSVRRESPFPISTPATKRNLPLVH